MMIKLKIVTPEGLYKEINTSIINVDSTDGRRGILPNHMPIVLMLNISRLETIEDGNRVQYAIGGGMLYFSNNEANVLVNSVESKDDIDVERANEAKKRAEGYLNSNDPNIDIKRAKLALSRALNRINVVSYK